MPVHSRPPATVNDFVPDAVLVQRMWQGNLDALGELYDRYSGLVYTTALRSLGDGASAEDLTQDVFLTLMHRRAYDPQRSSLGSYLSLLTRSRAIDRLRARATRHRYLSQWSRHQVFAPQPAGAG